MASPYDIAIHISMQNGVSPVLALIAKDMLGLQMSAEKLEKAFARVGNSLKLMAGGAAGIFGGVEIGKGLLDIADKGEKLIHQQNMLVRAGVQYNDVLKLTGDAYKRIAKEVPTATGADVLRSINELRSVTGDTARAEAATPMSLKLEALLSNATGKSAEGEGFKLWRAMEMKGITTSDPALTQKLMGAIIQDILGSGGKLDAGTYQAMAKTGGAAWIHASPGFITGPGSVLAGDLGGDRAGTAMMTLYQFLTGATTMSKQQYGVLKEAGLIDPTKVTTDKGGRINAQPGAIKGSLEHADNLYEWAQSIKPQLEALAKIKGGKDAFGNLLDNDIFNANLAKIGRNRNATKLLTMFTDPGFGDQIAKDISLWAQAQGIDDSYNTMIGRAAPITSQMQLSGGIGARDKQAEDARKMADYTAVMAAFQTQWESLMMAVGGPVARGLTPMLQGLTAELTKAGNWAETHQTQVKYIAEGIAAIAAAMVVMGGVAVVAGAAMIIGPVTAAVAAISLAVAAFAAMNWGAVASGFNMLVEAMTRFFAVIDSIPGRLGFVPQKSTDPYTDSQIDAAYKRQNSPGAWGQMGHEEANGRALMRMVPSVKTDVQVGITVSGDLKGMINAAVSSVRTTNSTSGYDSSAGETYPDHGYH